MNVIKRNNRYIQVMLLIVFVFGIGLSIYKLEKNRNEEMKLSHVEDLVNRHISNGQKDKAINLIRENMESLKPRDYKHNIDDILDFIEDVIVPIDPNLAIDIIKESEYKYLNLPDKIYLKVINTARQLYLLTNNYAEASEAFVRSINIADKLGYKYEEAKSMVELGILFKKIKGEESAIEIIEESLKVQIDDKVKDADTKVYALLNLCDLYLSIGDYQQAQKHSKEIPLYKKFFSEEDYRDIEILKYNIDAQICIYKNNLKQARACLDKSLELQKIDKNQYYYEKGIPYSLAMGKLYEAENEYDKAKSLYKEILLKAGTEKNYYLYEIVVKKVINIEDDINLKNKYMNQLILLTEYEQDKRYEDYTLNLLYRIEYENEMSKQYSFKMLVYKILLLVLLLMAIFKKHVIKLAKKNSYDVLTYSYNRRVFDKAYKRLIKTKKKFSLVIMDIDNFKKLNDTYGHQFGDKVLIDVCKLIQSQISKNYKLYRYGGEEFVIIAQKENFEDVLKKLDDIRKSIELMIWTYDIKVTVSMGMSNSDHGHNALENADKNLYISKNTGKNKITYE